MLGSIVMKQWRSINKPMSENTVGRFATILSQVIQNTLVLTQRWFAGRFLHTSLPTHNFTNHQEIQNTLALNLSNLSLTFTSNSKYALSNMDVVRR